MNFEKYAAAMAQHLDESIEGLGLNDKDAKPVEARPFTRVRKPMNPAQPTVSQESFEKVQTAHRKQSALFPGMDPKLARWID